MANWIIQCADCYLSVFYDYLQEKMHNYHVLQVDETPVLVNKDGNPARVKLHVGILNRTDVYMFWWYHFRNLRIVSLNDFRQILFYLLIKPGKVSMCPDS